MTSRVSSGHGTLADRVAGRSPALRLPASVWVSMDGARHPGILLEWLREESGWKARVVWASSVSAVHVEVLAGDVIEPVPAPR